MHSKAPEENINKSIKKIDSYFKSALSVDCVIFGYDKENEELLLLTLKSDIPPYKGLHCLVGDLVQINENIDDAATRVLRERTGIDNVFLHQVRAFGDVDRHPVGRVVTVAYYALVQPASIKLNTDQPPHPTWKSLENLQSKPMAFDHKEILHESLLHIQNHILDIPVESMLPSHFTLSELQSLYEAILQKPLDKRNFRKKVLKLNLIRETSRVQKNVTHRPAKLYTFNREGKESVL